jgi:UDP-N-acetylmuramoyl-tripeptide--D-alanyl-D-alanine ligase
VPEPVHWVEVPAMAGAICAAVTDDRPVFRSVLVKGSRFMRMERVVQALQALEHARQPGLLKDNAHAA